MKKILTISALLLAAIVSVKAQTEVLFKIKMLPSHDYASTMKMNMNMEMNYDGDAATMEKIKASGVTMPIIMLMESGSTADIKTGAVNSKKEFPFTMTMQSAPVKMTMNGKETPVPAASTAAQTMYGKCPVGGMLEVDSIPGTAMSDTVKSTMKKMLKSIMANVDFPAKAMKVGDTFTQEVPFAMPMAGMDMKMKTKSTYKLLSIGAGKANFDVTSTIVMDMQLGSTPGSMNMSGGGTGTMVYDIATSYPSSVNQSMDINYSLAIPQQTMTMKGKMKILVDQQTVVK